MNTIINGIIVELEAYRENGEDRSYCHLHKRTGNGTRYAASLALAEDTGGLPYESGPGTPELGVNAYGEEHYAVDSKTIEAISEWAVAHGY